MLPNGWTAGMRSRHSIGNARFYRSRNLLHRRDGQVAHHDDVVAAAHEADYGDRAAARAAGPVGALAQRLDVQRDVREPVAEQLVLGVAFRGGTRDQLE